MNKKLNVQLASLPDRENVVYEIYEGTNQVAEISNEPNKGLQIEVFSSPDGIWRFDFNEFYTLIEQARRNLGYYPDDFDV
ncbi:hypothetical protein ACGVWS_01465 [Enterobacteriaceae bacterium LUAb1]